MQASPTALMSDFVRQYPLRSFKRHETIIFQDDSPSTVYYIKSGFIKGYDIDSQGSEQLVWLGADGDICPFSWIFEDEQRIPYFFTAMNNVEAYAVRRTDLRRFLDSNIELLRHATKSLAARLTNTFHHINAVEKARAEEKIIYTLYFLSKRFTEYSKRPTDKVVLPLNHQDIASLAGVSRETAAQELKKLKEKGFIQYDKFSFIIHPYKLETIL